MSLNRGVGNSQRALSVVEEGRKGGGSQLGEVRPGVFALLWALDLTLKVVPSLKMEGQSLCPGQGQVWRRPSRTGFRHSLFRTYFLSTGQFSWACLQWGTGRHLLPNVLFILLRKKWSLHSGSLGGRLVLADGSNGDRHSFFQVSDVS